MTLAGVAAASSTTAAPGCDSMKAATCVLGLTLPSDITDADAYCPYLNEAEACYKGCDDTTSKTVTDAYAESRKTLDCPSCATGAALAGGAAAMMAVNFFA